MTQAFVIVLREGFEAFLIVAITLSYLQKTQRKSLFPAVYWGIFLSVLASAGLGYLMREGVGKSFWEGVMGLVAVVLVGSLVVHMMKTASKMKNEMEHQLAEATSHKNNKSAYLGVLIFTVFMVAREGFETVILLIQVHEPRFVTGLVLGVAAAVLVCYAWTRYSYLINLKRFFQVTSIFLLLFLVQIAIYSFHEFSEAGIFPNSEFWHAATEPYSPDGYYGKWFSLLMVVGCMAWLFFAWLSDKLSSKKVFPAS